MTTTYHSLSLDILQDLIEPILGEILVEALLREKITREKYGSVRHPKLINDQGELGNRMEIIDNKLIFQNSNSQLGSNGNNNSNGTPVPGNGGSQSTSNGNGNGDYFQCLNCDRRIAGSRFAAHIDKCLGGRTRK